MDDHWLLRHKALNMGSLHAQVSPTWHTYRRQPPQRPARDSQPWTTTRCHRLLRPVKTHIVALRRDMGLDSADAELLSECEDGSGNGHSSTVGTIVGEPRSSKGRIQHTYSRRGRKPTAEATSHAAQPRESQAGKTSRTSKLSSRKALQPGEIVLPTPVIRRARQQFASPVRQPELGGRIPASLGAKGDLKPSSILSALETEMLPLRYRIPSTRFALYESILRALHALLVATAAPPPVKTSSAALSQVTTTNTKSLMAMCLRKVPEYIGELEYWEQRDAEEEGTKSALHVSKVSNEVYEAVQDMLPSSRGCSHLRTIVREHGMRVVRDAVVEGLLDDSFSLLLVALCFRTKAYLEAEGLLEVVLDRSYPKPKSVDSTFDEGRRLAPLRMLRELARESGRPQFMLRQLSKLMKLQKLPLDWLSTREFASTWSGIVKVLSGDAVCDDTVSCAAHMILLLSSQARLSPFALRPGRGDLQSLSQQTLISAVTALASFHLLRQDARVGSARHSAQNAACAISKRIEYIIEACTYEMKRARKSDWISTVLNLSAHLANTTHTRLATDISRSWHRIIDGCNRRDGKQYYEATTAFLCSLARCCSQGAAEPSHYYLIKFCNQLDSMVSIQDEKLRKMRTDCAFLLAERTNDMRDLASAESFHGSTGTTTENEGENYTPKTRSSTYLFTGFRWDGDISEWVTATPAPQPQHSATQTRELRRESADQTCRDETHDDSGVSDLEAATLANRRGFYRKTPKRRTRISATRTSRCAQQQGSATALSTRKRHLAVDGLLSRQSSDDEEGVEESERMPQSQSQPQRGHPHRASGQENRVGAVSDAGVTKRRGRVGDAAVLKPRRVMLRTITNVGHQDLSDDELGL